jgi:energy-coupling factor transport system permease protein
MRASYLPDASGGFISGLDVRVKLLLCFMGSIVSIALSSPLSLGLLTILTTAMALGAARPSAIFKLYLVNVLMFALAVGSSALIGLAAPSLTRWNIFSLTAPFLRMLASVNLLFAFALSTPVQVLFSRLQAMRLPAWLFIPLSVAIRFVPTFLGDCAQIRDAARLRPGKGLAGLWRGLAVPLVFRMLHTADDLAVAAELKGVGAASQATKPSQSKFSTRDGLALALAGWVILLAILLQKFGPQLRPMPM